MLFNALVIGLLYIVLLMFIISYMYINLSNLNNKYKIIAYLLIILIICYYSNYLTDNKLGIWYISCLFYAFISIYIIFYNNKCTLDKRALIFAIFTGSLAINFIMGSIYTKTENDRLKLAYFELNRIDDNIIKFLVRESLIKARMELLPGEFNNNTDYKYQSYKIWSASKIKSENLITEYFFLDSLKNYLGGVNFSFPYELSKNWAKDEEINNFKIVIDTLYSRNSLLISGITPINNGKYYFCLSVLFNKSGYNFADAPSLINPIPSNKINFDDYRIFWVNNFSNVFKKADIELNKEDIKFLINNYNSEGFISKSINSQNFMFYVVRTGQTNNFTIIGYKTRDFSWNIYDFVKIFIVHFIFILAIGLVSVIIRIFKTGLPPFNYQGRILFAFLVVTLIPLIILAVYFDDTITNKLENSIRLNLMTQANKTGNFLELYGQNNNISFRELIIRTNNDLDINFTLFSKNEVKYSTYLDYYYLGGLSFYLDYGIYNKFISNKTNETFIKRTINNNIVYSYYKRVNIKGTEYLLEVNDAVNKFYMVFDTAEINLFLYGIYSFAIIIIVLMSILLTRRISKPVLSLTKAAGEVANGNFNIKLETKDKGDIGNLISSFNFMVKELNRIKEELSIKEREAAWREMAKQVAHEIKNPLTPMKLSIQLLIQAFNDKSNKFDDIFKKVSTTVLNQIETLKRIADEFSVVAKLPPLNIKQYNIVELVSDLLKLYSGENINISSFYSTEIILLNLDSEQFKRVLINLIKNSIEAEATDININIINDDNYVTLFIEDNGKGIDKVNSNKIFEDKFTTKTEGSGIGLTIVKSTLAAFNSKIELVESTIGKTLFKITFTKKE